MQRGSPQHSIGAMQQVPGGQPDPSSLQVGYAEQKWAVTYTQLQRHVARFCMHVHRGLPLQSRMKHS
jgi:hypothetical protein